MTTSTASTQIAVNNGRLLLLMTLDPKEIGRRIASARDQRGWTQFELANHANVSLSTIARWESGKLPPVRELRRVAGVLGVEPSYLVEGEVSKEPASPLDLESLAASVESLRQSQDDRLTELEGLLRQLLEARSQPQ